MLIKRENLEQSENVHIEGLKNGSYKAFNTIYQIYAKRLYAFCLQYTKSVENAEDIVQDVFVNLWRNRKNIHQNETLRSLLFVMAKNLLINAYRKKVNHPFVENDLQIADLESPDSLCQELEYDEFRKHFLLVINKLPITQQNVIKLSKIHQLSNKEIAEIIPKRTNGQKSIVIRS